MPATCHRVIGIVEVDSFPELALQLEAPVSSRQSPADTRRGGSHPRLVRFATNSSVIADVQQLAVDLMIELERYQRDSAPSLLAP